MILMNAPLQDSFSFEVTFKTDTILHERGIKVSACPWCVFLDTHSHFQDAMCYKDVLMWLIVSPFPFS